MEKLKNTPVLTLRKVVHRKEIILSVSFDKHFNIKQILHHNLGYKFSRTLRAWYTPFSKENIVILKKQFKDDVLFIEDVSLGAPENYAQRTSRNITEENKDIIRAYVRYLKGKRYSDSTIRVYFGFIADFVDYLKNKDFKTLVNRDVELFIEDVFVARKMSISSQRQFISAVKSFADFYPECSINPEGLIRPSKSRYLPTVLSQEEVVDLIRSSKNLKHRAVITMIYSSGLRVGELIDLELRNINIDRKQIFVKNGKGRKDRYVMLANTFMPLLRNYVMTYRPEKYFVEGPKGEKYSASSIRKFLHNYAKRANITKRVTPHTLRHSYATHLLENGIGLRHIQELLGHSKPETTMIYTHVAKKDLLEIESPLDNIILSLEKNEEEEQKFLLSGNNFRKKGK